MRSGGKTILLEKGKSECGSRIERDEVCSCVQGGGKRKGGCWTIMPLPPSSHSCSEEVTASSLVHLIVNSPIPSPIANGKMLH